MFRIPIAVICTLIAAQALWGDKNPDPAKTPPSKPFPVELACGVNRPSQSDRLAISPDGSRVAYTVSVSAPNPLGTSEANTETPPTAQGHRLYVAETATEAIRAVGGEKAASWGASWSPDGKTVAFYSDESGEVGLWLYKVGGAAPSRLGKVVVGASHHMRPEWTPDGKRVLVPAVMPKPKVNQGAAPPTRPETPPPASEGPTVVVRKTGREREPQPVQKPVETPPVGEQPLVAGRAASLTAVSVADGTTTILVPAGERATFVAAKLSPSGKYLACESSLRAVAGKELTVLIDLEIVRRGDGSVVHEAKGVELDLNIDPTSPTLVSMAWHPSSDLLAYLKGGKLLVIDAAGEKPAPRELSLGENGGKVNRITFSRDGKNLVASVPAVDSRVEDPSLAAVRMIPLDGKPLRELLPPDGVKLRGVVSADWRTAWQPAADAVIASGTEKATGSQVFVRMPIDGTPAAVAAKVDGQVRVVAAGGDHGRAVALVENATTPADFYTVSPVGKSGVRLSRVEPRLEGVTVGPVESFTTKIVTDKGEERSVRSAVALPPGGKKGNKFPTIVALYPGMNLSGQSRSFGGGDVSSIPAAVFTTRGYAVLLTDVPLGPFDVPSNPLREIHDAVLPQIRRAAELGYTDIDRVGVAGHSFGGYGTACLVCGADLFKAAVAMNGSYDLAGVYATQRADEPETGGLNLNMYYFEKHQGRMGKPLWDEPKRYLDNSPYFQANRIRTPMLLVHGREDTNCPVGEAEKLYNSLVRLERTAQLAIYGGEGHVPGEWGRANRLDLTNRAVAFFDRYLKPGKGDGK